MTARVMLATPMTTTMARWMLPTRTTPTQTFQNLCRNIRFSGLAEGGLRVVCRPREDGVLGLSRSLLVRSPCAKRLQDAALHGASHDRSCIPRSPASEGSLTSRRVGTPQGYRHDAYEPLAPGRRR